MERFIVSARKYRPDNFLSLIGQDSIATTLKNSIKRGQLAHAYLFCGPRGVGKTSTARIFAKTINCMNLSPDLEPCGECESCRSFAEGRSYCIHELDAASNNSVDDIRSLTEKVRIPPQIGKYSVYIIDEVHMLSTAAFNAFLKTLEEPPSHAIFILATTEKHKILPTILSRCQTYDFNRISVKDIVANLESIARKEGIEIDSQSLHVIAMKADGAMRDALTLFDQTVAFCGTRVTYEQVIKNLNVLDYEYYFNIVECSLRGDFPKSLLLFDQILSKGFNALYFVGGLSSHLRNLTVCKDVSTMKLLEVSPSLEERYVAQSKECSFKFLYEALSHTVKCESEYKASGNQRLLVEFMLMKLANISAAISAAASRADSTVAVSKPAAKPENTARAAEIQFSAGPVAAGSVTAEKSGHQRRSGISLKEMLQSAEQAASMESKQDSQAEDEEITQEALEAAWMKMAESQKAYPRLGLAIKNSKPGLESDGTTVLFHVSNLVQKEWIERNAMETLENFLRKELRNGKINIQIMVREVEQTGKKLYLPQEKAEYIFKNYPEANELRKDLDLDIR
ncbi:MAG: DNA polymerase III subunit gamma/tau [Bacteroidetes bacterium]|uniref:DNA polymerase III subunit gamma/tau n=1 Tax=Candidatus Egerieousia excrementavium TaxID=2840778 RepID=A0A9D9GXS3_9BACT|nr:DNA polymerase III subunit gamma/tau [Candidatus Egerieousia excrementavium]